MTVRWMGLIWMRPTLNSLVSIKLNTFCRVLPNADWQPLIDDVHMQFRLGQLSAGNFANQQAVGG